MVKILHISDWHVCGIKEVTDRLGAIDRYYQTVPDQIVMTGDMLFNTAAWRGQLFELEAEHQREFWENELVPCIRAHYPSADLIAVPGNHDYCNYGIEGVVHSIDDGADTFTIGGVKYTGFRGVTRYDGRWNRELPEGVIDHLCSQMDKNADVVITHVPAKFILGGTHPLHYGSEALSEWLDKVNCNVKAHLFGHAHEAGGNMFVNSRNVIHSNAADCHNLMVIDPKTGFRRIWHPVYGLENPENREFAPAMTGEVAG